MQEWKKIMLFNSIDFAVFLPIVFVLYWFVTHKSLRLQNLLIVLASYIFYGWWDWMFLSLIIYSTIVDFSVGILLSKQEDVAKRKLLLCLSILVNLGFLGFFKYYNFFLDNFIAAFSFFGRDINASSLNIILPVGISFYTFQTLSYTIDVYKRKLEATRDIIAFAAYVSFFPQLVAGPIEKATNLLHQFYKKRTFNYENAVDGLRQILWGLFKKVVIADHCAVYANFIFNNSIDLPSSTLILGGLFFAFQIYGDFSGYSDVAIGTARLFGFNLMQNFAFPYFSRDIAEFWRRWHISLSTWFRDYLYIPLGGSREGRNKAIRNVFIIFIVSGFWHGANWTFIIWGALNAIYFLPLLLTNKNRRNLDTIAKGKYLPSLKELTNMSLTFGMTVIGWIFFRAENIEHAFNYLLGVFSFSISTMPDLTNALQSLEKASTGINVSYITYLLIIFLLIEWVGREEKYALAKLGRTWSRPLRWGIYYFLLGVIIIFSGEQQEFIYFQF